MPKVSVTIITHNEAAHIAEALASVAWADEIVVVDSMSTDETAAIARSFTPHVVVREWPGYIAQKNPAASLAANDWIFSLDADERVTPGLAREVQETMAAAPAHGGFRMPRVTFHLDRWIRTTDWYPDPQLRLYDRRRATWKPRRVHESVEANGAVVQLTHDLQHFAYRDIGHHLTTMDRYTTLAAEQMDADGKKAGLADLVSGRAVRKLAAAIGAADHVHVMPLRHQPSRKVIRPALRASQRQSNPFGDQSQFHVVDSVRCAAGRDQRPADGSGSVALVTRALR